MILNLHMKKHSVNTEKLTTNQKEMLILSPQVHPTVVKFLKEEKTLDALLDGLGSPLNVLFPKRIADNAQAFREVFAKHYLVSKIFFAHKTNKSSSFVKEGYMSGINIDVASMYELKDALAAGFTGERIEATGPKNEAFILLCLQQDVVINVDSFAELQEIKKVYKSLDLSKKIRIVIRLNNFKSDYTSILAKDSRFGIPTESINEIINFIQENVDIFTVLGVSFHLDTIEIKEKIIAIENAIEIIDILRRKGFQANILNIGGGYKVNYLAYEKEWNAYISALKDAAATGKAMSWHNNTFGLRVDNGKIKGSLNIYNYFDASTGADYLDQLFSSPSAVYQNRAIGTVLSENMIEVWIEPGRALLDQCGITATKVTSLKKSAHGETLIGLDMKRSDVVFLDQELFVDPIILYKQKNDEEISQGVYFTGNLCLETDLIYRRKVFLSQLPSVGDTVIFINTAGYMMDFNSSDTILQPIAEKVAVAPRGEDFHWVMDEKYNPLHFKEEQYGHK